MSQKVKEKFKPAVPVKHTVKPAVPVRIWNFTNSGKGLFTWWAVCFTGALSSIFILKVRYIKHRRAVVKEKVLERHLSASLTK